MRRSLGGGIAAVSAAWLVMGPMGGLHVAAGGAAPSDTTSVAAPQPEGEAIAGPTLAPLTATQKDRAANILASDPDATRLLGARQYDIIEQGPWTKTGSTVLLGVAMHVRLATSTNFASQTWPTIDYDSGTNSYAVDNVQQSASGVRDLAVLVDLQRGQVASIAPDATADITPAPGSDIKSADTVTTD